MKDLGEAAYYMLSTADEIEIIGNALLGAMELFDVKNSLIGHNDDKSRGVKIRCDSGISGIVTLVKMYCDNMAQYIEMEAREALESAESE